MAKNSLSFVLLIAIFGFVIEAKHDAKIVGGEAILIEEAPHQASLRSWKSHICGASVINENFVITAAHCVYPDVSKNHEVRVGSASRLSDGDYYSIRRAYIHPDYSMLTLDYDIAILKIEGNFSYNERVQPIDMVEDELEIADGTDVNVTGWGLTQESGIPSDVLQRVTVPTVNEERCKKAYRGLVAITSRMLCAGAEQGGLDACQGDSGGGLTYKGRLAGVVSFGLGCARPNYPGVYSRIAAFKDWIESIIVENI